MTNKSSNDITCPSKEEKKKEIKKSLKVFQKII